MAVCGEGDPTESGRLRLEAAGDVASQNPYGEPVLDLSAQASALRKLTELW